MCVRDQLESFTPEMSLDPPYATQARFRLSYICDIDCLTCALTFLCVPYSRFCDQLESFTPEMSLDSPYATQARFRLSYT